MDNNQNNKQKGQMQLELNGEVAQGIYSNLAIISHSSSEFVIDFARIMPGVPKAMVKSRIVITPEHAKRLLHALADNVKRYENEHGAIKEPGKGDEEGFLPMNFGPPGQA